MPQPSQCSLHLRFFIGQEDEQGIAVLADPGRAAAPMDERRGRGGRIELNDPMNIGDVDATCHDVGAGENAVFRSTKAVEGVFSFALFSLAVDQRDRGFESRLQDGAEIFDAGTRAEKHHHFLFGAFPQERN